MPSDSLSSLRIVVGGGSLGGLCAGLALRAHGATVNIFERHPGPMEMRGGGIVVQESLTTLLQHSGAAAPLPMTSCQGRRYLSPEGGDGQTQSMPQRFTSWEAIYLTLRASFPELNYHTGAALEGFDTVENAVRVDIAGHGQVHADLLVCADGAQSETRRRLLPQVKQHYAGYIAWRGMVDEAAASRDLVKFFDNTFTFSEARDGGHILVYLIPGQGGDVRPGHRLLNWVWYVHASDQELSRLLTDKTGRQHHNSLPLGMASEEALAELRARARRDVHLRMADLIEATHEPFIQTIVDVVVPRTVFGRGCLLGDAAFVVRPHTAGSTAKAASDAMLLADLLDKSKGDVTSALSTFQPLQMRYGNELHQYGVALGNRWATAH
jgi:2-polyprenyl-6-methoxyphenol hydroxylase-like FAD-dependent oxidoreductase